MLSAPAPPCPGHRGPECTATEVIMWIYIASLLTTRVLVLAQGVGLVIKRRSQLRPSAVAKVCVRR